MNSFLLSGSEHYQLATFCMYTTYETGYMKDQSVICLTVVDVLILAVPNTIQLTASCSTFHTYTQYLHLIVWYGNVSSIH
jgi:hypothetical protein